jgi:DNA-binding response OmpR family regulator
MVVDPCEADYAAVVVAGESSGIRCTFLQTGEQAVRRHADAGVRAWMINVQLSDMTGLELYQRLQPRLEKIPVIIVDDHYDAVHELSVLAVGHPYYAWKPLDGSWVGKLRPAVL